MRKVLEAVWKSLLPRSPVFTTAEAADIAGISLSNASRDLAKAAERNLLTRVRRGVWAVTQHPDFSAYAVVPYLFRSKESGYVSLLSALGVHGVIEQIPRNVQVMTLKQRPKLRTPVGTFEFHKILGKLFGGVEPYQMTRPFDLATPEKALFDVLYLSARRGRRFSALPEIELPADFSEVALLSWIEKIELRPLRIAVAQRWDNLSEGDYTRSKRNAVLARHRARTAVTR